MSGLGLRALRYDPTSRVQGIGLNESSKKSKIVFDLQI